MSADDYSPATHEQPLELEASTSEASRTPEPGDAVEGLTIAEAAAAYGLSVSSLRRKLKAGELSGAVKVPGPKGEEYRIPPAALEALGYRAKETRAGAVLTAARAGVELEEMSARVKELEAKLELETLRRELSEERERIREQQVDDLRALADSLRVALDKLPAALEAPKRRGLFRRK